MLPPFSIASPKALTDYDADTATLDPDGNPVPQGTFGTEHPIGTGPLKFEEWIRNDRLTLTRFDDYWGEPSLLDEVIFRPIPDNAARLQALQTGEIDGYDLVDPQDRETIASDSELQLIERPSFNVGYVAFNQTVAPLDNIDVRRAIAHALNRQAVIDNIYGDSGEVPVVFMPPSVQGWTDDVTIYDYDPDEARALLEGTGLELPIAIDFWYPADVSRPYMPDPRRIAEAFASDLGEVGFEVNLQSAPWTPDYLDAALNGRAPVHLLGQTGDFGDPETFVGTFFRTERPDFGFDNPELRQALEDALRITDVDERTAAYEEINRTIMDILPGRPVRPLDVQPGVPLERRRFRRQPRHHGELRHRVDRGVAGTPHGALRGTPAAPRHSGPPRRLVPRLRLDEGAARRTGAGAARRTGDARGGRRHRAPVRPRPAARRAVREVPGARRLGRLRAERRDAAPGHSTSCASGSRPRSSWPWRRCCSPLSSACPLGVIAAKHAHRPLDHVSLVGSLIGISMPVFFLALILKWAFAVQLGWLPSIGRLDVKTDLDRRTNLFIVDSIISANWAALWDTIRHLILPAIALGTIPLAIITRITRTAVLEVMQEDHVRTARAKGLSPRLVDRRHILRNALLPVITVIGLQVGLLLSGAILTETVFAWGGLGTWIYDAVGARDYAVLQGGILFIVVVFVIVNLLVDLGYSLIDPTDPVSLSVARNCRPPSALPTDEPVAPPSVRSRDVLLRLRRNPGALVGLAIVGLVVVARRVRPADRPGDAVGAGVPRSPRRTVLPRSVGGPLVRARRPRP